MPESSAPTPAITPELIRDHNRTPEEYQKILDLLGREPTLTELGIFSVMWSEHCSYKSSRVHLKKLPTEGIRVLEGPGENAGVVDIGDGLCAVFKIESHNHPSFVEPFQGAATGVGGILRDVFTMGARPVAVLNSLRFGPLEAARELRDPLVRRGSGRVGLVPPLPTEGHGRDHEGRGADAQRAAQVLAADVVDELAILRVREQLVRRHEVDERRRVDELTEEPAARLHLDDVDALAGEARPRIERLGADHAHIVTTVGEPRGVLIGQAFGSAHRGERAFGEQDAHYRSSCTPLAAGPARTLLRRAR